MNEETQQAETELNPEELELPEDVELIAEIAPEQTLAEDQLAGERSADEQAAEPEPVDGLSNEDLTDEELADTTVTVEDELPESEEGERSIELVSTDDEQGDEADENIEALLNENADSFVELPAETEAVADEQITATHEELKPAIEGLLFVADEPLPFKHLCKVLGDVPETEVLAALNELASDYEARNSGLEVREIAGGWRISTRPQNHEFIRKYLKSRPSARLSLPALETLAVIAYKQPITIPEILEIRGVSSSSAIKTLLEKRLIVTKGRKETVGKPMMYGTSKEFMIQFGLKDLNELPSIEDFEDLAQ